MGYLMASSSPPPQSPPVSPPTSGSVPAKPSIAQGSAVEKVNGLLKQLLRISVTDGRIFIGTFAGTDKPLNLLLINAEEYRVGPAEDPDGRYVGQIMIPWKVIVKVEAHVVPPKPPPPPVPDRPRRRIEVESSDEEDDDGMYT